jgi:GNAT superfamily N-acetyltransferase
VYKAPPWALAIEATIDRASSVSRSEPVRTAPIAEGLQHLNHDPQRQQECPPYLACGCSVTRLGCLKVLPAILFSDRMAFEPAYGMADVVARIHAMFILDDPPLVSLGSESDLARPLEQDDVAMYLWQEHVRANSACYALTERTTSDLIGTLSILVPDPTDLTPWIGILHISAQHRRKGYGREALSAIHVRLPALGWSSVRCAVEVGRPSSLPFWTRMRYQQLEQRQDDAGRPVLVLERRLY